MEALTGNLGMIICFVVGSGLILLEAFMPEFGAAGIAGIILEILGILITSKLYGTGWALLAIEEQSGAGQRRSTCSE